MGSEESGRGLDLSQGIVSLELLIQGVNGWVGIGYHSLLIWAAASSIEDQHRYGVKTMVLE